MEAFFVYFLKSFGVILLFLSCYKFFLSRETFHIGNRYFLLSGLVLAIVLPLISYTKTVWVDIRSLDVPLVESIVPEATNEVVPEIGLSSILFVIYVIGILYGTIRLLVQLLSLRKIFRNSRIVQEGKFKVLESTKPLQPFSFFNYIIYHPESHSKEDIKAIVAHEKIHSRQYHSVDILAVHLFAIFQWCNPFIYLYKFYVKENLEFIADYNTLSTEIPKKKYQYLLLKNNMEEKHLLFVNPFFNSSVKKRIVMLNKKKSKKRNSVKYGLVLPLLIGFVLLFNVETVAKIRTISPSTIGADQEQKLIDPKIYSISKEASDDEIEALKIKIKKEEGKLSIENLKRNSEGQIIAISVTYNVRDGGYVTGNYDEEDNINTIHFGQNEKGGLFITTDETTLTELKMGEMPKLKRQDFSRADVYSVHKNTSDSELKQIKSKIEKKGGEFSYTHKRNSKGEIIDLELEIRSEGTGYFKSEPPFERCYFGSFQDGGIFVADDEKSFNQLKTRNAKNSKGLGNNIKEIKNDKFNEVVYDKDKSGDFPTLTVLNSRFASPSSLLIGSETPLKSVFTAGQENIDNANVNEDKEIKDSTEKSPWKVSAGLSPKNKDKMTASELHAYYQKQTPNALQQDMEVALIIVDGKEMSKKEFDKIPTDEIESMSVLKGKSAEKKYGKKGESGVLEIELKKREIIVGGADRSPLIIIDGQEASKEKMKNIDQDKIKSVSILKDEQAVKKYGKKAKDGAVEITMKKE